MKEYGWQPQVYEVNSKSARGPYGKNFQLNNIVTNPLKSSGWSGDAEHGGDAGLELWVRANHIDGLVSGSEIVSARTDALLGSFRVGMKLSNSSGTCGAFFFVCLASYARTYQLLTVDSTTTTLKRSTWNSYRTSSTNRKAL
jgi:hypothetical protein